MQTNILQLTLSNKEKREKLNKYMSAFKGSNTEKPSRNRGKQQLKGD